MPGKRQFCFDGKDADLFSFPSFSSSIARQNKSRFRKIHLARQSLHLGVTQSASIGKDRQRITRERGLGEHINLHEVVSAMRHKRLVHIYPNTRKKISMLYSLVSTAYVLIFASTRSRNFSENRRSTAALQSASRKR